MSAHVLLNLFNELGFATSLINTTIQEHGCWILFIILHEDYF